MGLTTKKSKEEGEHRPYPVTVADEHFEEEPFQRRQFWPGARGPEEGFETFAAIHLRINTNISSQRELVFFQEDAMGLALVPHVSINFRKLLKRLRAKIRV